MLSNKEWWHTDSKGRRIGYMWPEDLLLILDSIWGRRKGIGGFSDYAGLHRATIERYCNGKNAIPKHIALMALMLQKLMPGKTTSSVSYNMREFPTADADWLNDERVTSAYSALIKN